jgi:cytoplasmic tRNA 2-thiolation protein 1
MNKMGQKSCMKCSNCGKPKFAVKRMWNNAPMCKECFLFQFEEEIHQAIVDHQVFQPGEIIAVAVSGGKGFFNN